MGDRYYDNAKIPQETQALIDALVDEAMRDVAMMALHTRFRVLCSMYDGDIPMPPEVASGSWSDKRAHSARIEKESDAIKDAARKNGFGGCHNPPMNCDHGCWFDQDPFGGKR